MAAMKSHVFFLECLVIQSDLGLNQSRKGQIKKQRENRKRIIRFVNLWKIETEQVKYTLFINIE